MEDYDKKYRKNWQRAIFYLEKVLDSRRVKEIHDEIHVRGHFKDDIRAAIALAILDDMIPDYMADNESFLDTELYGEADHYSDCIKAAYVTAKHEITY